MTIAEPTNIDVLSNMAYQFGAPHEQLQRGERIRSRPASLGLAQHMDVGPKESTQHPRDRSSITAADHAPPPPDSA